MTIKLTHCERDATDGLGECSVRIPRMLAILIESDALKTVRYTRIFT